MRSGLHPSSGGTPGYGGYGHHAGSGSNAYGMHSFKSGAHQRHRTLTDIDAADYEEEDKKIGRSHGHAAYIVGGGGGKGRDGDSEQGEEDQKHILQAQSRERNGSGSDLDDGGSGGEGRGDAWIVKTVDYTVSESMSIRGQAR